MHIQFEITPAGRAVLAQQCERCGIPANETPEGMLAFSGKRLVCADCDEELTSDHCAETGALHPLDTLCPAAGGRDQ